ncbi:MAG: hypothetical protein HOV71_27060 [Hamadaea sp.]|nr:hypothetical protein [Hamadaea sp.]NUR51802.1 hypothetical protein [Hamadaea sp.]NUT07261.1 hypothetical protein [Hamadaea sp.]
MVRVMGKGAFAGLIAFAGAGGAALVLPADTSDFARSLALYLAAFVSAAVAAPLLGLRQWFLVPVLATVFNIVVNLLLGWLSRSSGGLALILSLPTPVLHCAYLMVLGAAAAIAAERVARANAEIDAGVR